MFWGLLLEPGKRYSAVVNNSFHVSMAALDCSSVKKDNEILKVIVEMEGQENLLCNLSKEKGILQEELDLNFMTGDIITFKCKGSGIVHLSGYMLSDDFEMEGDEEDGEEEYDEESEGENEDLDTGSEKDEDAKSDDEETKEEMSITPQQQNFASSQNKQKTPGKPINSNIVNGVTSKQQQSGKKDQKKGQSLQTSGQNTATNKGSTPGGGEDVSPKKRVVEGGVIVRDLKVGNGQSAKAGKLVHVYYTGRLMSTNKIFDSVNKGEGFKFRLGKGEVIKGWDIGINGMKVGGKRVITCPPNAAYGPKGSLPTIPPNSTLIFEVELKATN